jgi:peroxin-12
LHSQTLAEANPEKYLNAKNWSDEIYLLFDCVVQYSHLRAFKSSFPEHFYGLKRVPQGQRRLSSQQLWASFAIVSLVPYVRRKLDKLLDQLQHEESGNQTDGRTPAHYFLRIYPFFCFLIELSNLILQISYSLEKSDYHSIWNRLVRIQLVANSDAQKISLKSGGSPGWSSWFVAKFFAEMIGSCLSAGAFFIQFLDYYYAREGSVTGNLIRLPKPPAPHSSLYSRVKVNRLKDFCLLCNERRENDTVLSTSGYIYCYPCIKAFVARNKKCPATGIPSSQEHLIRLYQPQD